MAPEVTSPGAVAPVAELEVRGGGPVGAVEQFQDVALVEALALALALIEAQALRSSDD